MHNIVKSNMAWKIAIMTCIYDPPSEIVRAYPEVKSEYNIQ